MLKELVIKPTGGLGNRIRVIVSGMCLAEQFEAQLSIVFWEGDLRELIDLPDHIHVLSSPPSDIQDYAGFSGYEHDFTSTEKVYYEGCSVLRHISCDEAHLFDYPFYIQPAQPVVQKVNQLREALMLPDDFIAMHIRRGDHKRCMQLVPDDLVIAEIQQLVTKEPDICIAFACEDQKLRTYLREQFPHNIIIASQKTTAWAARFYMSSVINDFAELLLLSEARYVIGNEYSSYSSLMVAFNGNRESHLLGPSCYRYD